MSEQDARVLDLLLRQCDKLRNTVMKCKTYGGFLLDENAVDASLFRASVLSGVSKNELSSGMKAVMSDVNWNHICGLCNCLERDYDSIDRFELWQVMTNDIPMLSYTLRKVRGEMI